MKKFIAGLTIASLSFANSNLALNAKIGTGYIDNKYKSLILNIQKSAMINNYYIGATIAKNYFNSYFGIFPFICKNNIYVANDIGYEKFRIENTNKNQFFLRYRVFLDFKKNIAPKFTFSLGTKSVSTSIGIFLYPIKHKKITLEYELGKRFLYSKTENKTNTTSTAIYLNYFF
jgi:hypothetical protein